MGLGWFRVWFRVLGLGGFPVLARHSKPFVLELGLALRRDLVRLCYRWHYMIPFPGRQTFT